MKDARDDIIKVMLVDDMRGARTGFMMMPEQRSEHHRQLTGRGRRPSNRIPTAITAATA